MDPNKFAKYQREVKNWLQALPIANVGKSAEHVYKYVEKITDLPIDCEQKFVILEMFQETIAYLRKGLRKYYLEETPIPEKQKENVLKLAMALENTYANVYASLIPDLAKLKQSDELKRNRSIAVIEAIIHLTNILIICYELYLTAPEKLWLKLHKLYAHAERDKLHEYTIDRTIGNELEPRSVKAAYKRALLLAAASPYHLRYKDVDKLYDALVKWSDFAELSDTSEESLFVVYMDQDEGPHYRPVENNQNSNGNERGLDTLKLTDYIRSIAKQYLEDQRVQTEENVLSVNLIKYLEEAWGKFHRRKETRSQEQGQLNICLSLSACHHYLMGDDTFNPEHVSQFSSDTKAGTIEVSDLSIVEEQQDDSLELVPGAKKAASTDVDPWDPVAMYTQGKHVSISHFDTYVWNIFDHSSDGYGLTFSSDRPKRAVAGELIGLQHTEKQFDYEWSIGTIRWIKQDNEHVTKLGVEIIAPSATAIYIKFASSKKPRHFIRALQLPEIPRLNKPSTLILPPLEYHPGEDAHIVSENLEALITIKEILSENTSYCHVEYDITSKIKEEIAISDDLPEITENAEDSVWEDL